LCSAGNPGMASGGMGDVLTGVIAGLVAQGVESERAAQAGVALHAAAADKIALTGERGMLAGDVINALRSLVN
jgi:NAD(P)H-hydrate repair Nnr-like enzyme with NAD(P)H-hydrate dehydratase domain